MIVITGPLFYRAQELASLAHLLFDATADFGFALFLFAKLVIALFVHAFFESCYTAAKSLHHFRDFLASEEQQGDHPDTIQMVGLAGLAI